MARMTCKCGKLLDNHEAPNDIELIVYTDKEWDAICNCDSYIQIKNGMQFVIVTVYSLG